MPVSVPDVHPLQLSLAAGRYFPVASDPDHQAPFVISAFLRVSNKLTFGLRRSTQLAAIGVPVGPKIGLVVGTP
jgi:hypothetical protein